MSAAKFAPTKRIPIVFGSDNRRTDLSVKTIKTVQGHLQQLSVAVYGPKHAEDPRWRFTILDQRGPNEKAELIKAPFVYASSDAASEAGNALIEKIKHLNIA